MENNNIKIGIGKSAIIKIVVGVLIVLLISIFILPNFFNFVSSDKEDPTYPYDDLIETTVMGYDDYYLSKRVWTKSTASIYNNSYTNDNAVVFVFTFKRDATIESINFDYTDNITDDVAFRLYNPSIPDGISSWGVSGLEEGWKLQNSSVNVTFPFYVSKEENFVSNRVIDIREWKAGEQIRIQVCFKNSNGKFNAVNDKPENFTGRFLNIRWNEVM